LFNTILLLSRT